MADDLDVLEEWVGALIQKLSAGERRKLARAVSTDLRRESIDRIAAQRNPDGSGFIPRKRPPLRSKTGRIKSRASNMFQKLRRPAYLRADATENEAAVGFPNAQVSRIARVHQDGLRDTVTKKRGAATVRYPSRILLGFTEESRRNLLDRVMAHLEH